MDRVLVRVLVTGFAFVIFVRVFRVGYDDHLTQDLVKLVAPGFFVSTPLDEDIQAQQLDRLSRVDVGRLPQELVVPSMVMPDVGQDGKLDTPGQGDILSQAYQGLALHLRPLQPRHFCSALWVYVGSGSAYLFECMLYDHLPIRIGDTWKQVPYRLVRLFVDLLLRLWYRFGLAVLVAAGRIVTVANNGSCLLDYALTDMVADSVYMLGEGVVPLLGRLRVPNPKSASMGHEQRSRGATSAYRDDEDHSLLVSRYILAGLGQLGIANRDELEAWRRFLAVGDLRKG